MTKLPQSQEIFKWVAVLVGLAALGLAIVSTDQSRFKTAEDIRALIPGNPSIAGEVSVRAERYYIVSKEEPTFTEAVFDPFDVRQGEKQRVSVRVKNSVSVETVSVSLKTDNTQFTHELRLVEGTDKDGVWRGELPVSDTHDKIYDATLQAVSGSGKSKVELTFK